MGRAASQSCLTAEEFHASGLTYRRAGAQDDEDLRAILRGNIMDGWVRLSFEREPDYFSPLYRGECHQVIIGRETDTGEPAGMYARTTQRVYVNGRPRSVGYLGELRVVPKHHNRIRIIRDGFAAIDRLLHDPAIEPYCLTSIVSDNTPARRLLEAGINGLPVYTPYTELTTLILSTRARVRAGDCAISRGAPEDEADVLDCLARNGARRQFAPVWERADLAEDAGGTAPGLSDFLVARRSGRVVGCLALWDQSDVRQVVVRGYDRKIEKLRPFLNLLAPALRLPHMPDAGHRLKQVFLSHLAIDDDNPGTLICLLREALRRARQLGHELALLGLGRNDPMVRAVCKAVRAPRVESKIYLVHWPNQSSNLAGIDARAPQLEIGLL